MAQYSISNTQAGTQQVMTSAYKTIVALTAATATLRRAFIYDIVAGTDGTPSGNDGPVVYQWSRQTAAGTSTSATPNPLDAADSAAGTVASVNFTAEGTITASSELLTMTLNQRNTQRWIARDDKSRLVVPATNLAGIAGRAKSTVVSGYASTVIVEQMFDE